MADMRVYQVLLLLPLCKSTIYYIEDPIPFLSSSSGKIVFSEGGPAFHLSNTKLTRFASRGVINKANAVILDNLIDKDWHKFQCNFSAYSLCHSKTGEVFPSTQPRAGKQDTYHCKNSKGKLSSADPIYDISACDILQEDLDLLFTNEEIYVKRTRLSVGTYWTLVLSSIVLVRAVSLNILSKLHNDSNYHQYKIVLLNFVILGIILSEGEAHYVTENDLFFFWVNMLYITGYLIFHSYHAIYKLFSNDRHIEPRVFNLASASFQAIVMRLYCSAETPYVLLIAAMICTRMWEKLSQKRAMHTWTGLADALYLALLLYMGYEADTNYLFPLAMITKVLADKVRHNDPTMLQSKR